METKGCFFQFEIIIYVIVSASLEYLYICMLWVYGQSEYFYSFRIDFRRQIWRL